MAINITVSMEVKQTLKAMDATKNRAVPRITISALNKAATSAESNTRRSMAKALRLPAKEIKPRIFKIKANAARRFVWIGVTKKGQRPFNIIHWVSKSKRYPGAFRKRPGVRYRDFSGSKTLPGAFIAPARGSGKDLVFRRATSKRLPIVSKTGPSLAAVFNRRSIRGEISNIARRRFIKEFEHMLSRQLEREGLK